MTDTSCKTVYFVRHGQSVDNTKPVYPAKHNPLSQKGIEQAGQIAERLCELDFDVLLASPLERARHTAEIIGAKTGKQPEIHDFLQERIKPTSIDGKPWSDEQATAVFKLWQASLHEGGPRAEDGEDFAGIVARADQVLDYLQKRPEQHIVVVSHGYLLNVIIGRILTGQHLTPQINWIMQTHASPENTSVTTIEYREDYDEKLDWRLRSYNDHSHFTTA